MTFGADVVFAVPKVPGGSRLDCGMRRRVLVVPVAIESGGAERIVAGLATGPA